MIWITSWAFCHTAFAKCPRSDSASLPQLVIAPNLNVACAIYPKLAVAMWRKSFTAKILSFAFSVENNVHIRLWD